MKLQGQGEKAKIVTMFKQMYTKTSKKKICKLPTIAPIVASEVTLDIYGFLLSVTHSIFLLPSARNSPPDQSSSLGNDPKLYF